MAYDQPSSQFFDCVTSKSSIEAKFDSLLIYARDIGFNDIFYARLKDPGHSARASYENVHVMRGGDAEWHRVYDGENLAGADWAREYSSFAYQPYRLDRVPANLTSRQNDFVKLARKYNRHNGFAVPVRGAFGLVAGFSATAAAERPTEIQIAKMTSAALLYDLTIGASITDESALLMNLTDREIRLLRLYISGRSMTQIALMLGNSEQWIRRSFLRMRQKTNVASNTELIYRASKMRIV